MKIERRDLLSEMQILFKDEIVAEVTENNDALVLFFY